MQVTVQCDHFQQFYNKFYVKVHVPIIRWSHCASLTTKYQLELQYKKIVKYLLKASLMIVHSINSILYSIQCLSKF